MSDIFNFYLYFYKFKKCAVTDEKNPTFKYHIDKYHQ